MMVLEQNLGYFGIYSTNGIEGTERILHNKTKTYICSSLNATDFKEFLEAELWLDEDKTINDYNFSIEVIEDLRLECEKRGLNKES